MERLVTAQSVAHGIGMTLGGEDPGKTTAAVYKLAYPWIVEDDDG